MLELYHHGSSVCAAKVRLSLEEKQLPFTAHYIDILKGEQFEPAYMKLNPKAVVPTLVHDGHVVTDSAVICNYIEWVFPDALSLVPEDPLVRADMLHWTKFVDEELHPACGTITFMTSHRHTIMRLGPEKVEEFLQSTPRMSLVSDWKERKRRYVEKGLADPDAAKAIRVHEMLFSMMNETLSRQPFLAGEAYSLAETAVIPYVNRIHMLSMLQDWCADKPHVLDWFERMRARPTWDAAIEQYLPDHLANDLRTNGANSWPEVKRILDVEIAAFERA